MLNTIFAFIISTKACIFRFTEPLWLQDLSTSSAEELTAGLKTLQQHSSALQNEIGHCDRVLSILHQLAGQQVTCLSKSLPAEYKQSMRTIFGEETAIPKSYPRKPSALLPFDDSSFQVR